MLHRNSCRSHINIVSKKPIILQKIPVVSKAYCIEQAVCMEFRGLFIEWKGPA